CNQHAAAGADLGSDGLVPVGKNAIDSVLQALCQWNLAGLEVFISWIVMGRARIVGSERWGPDVITAAPELHLFFTVALDRFPFVQTLKGAVVAFIEPPRFGDWNPHPVHFFQREPERA